MKDEGSPIFTAVAYAKIADEALLACSRMVKTASCGLTVLCIMRRL